MIKGFLQREVRSLVSRVDAGTLLDLLAANTIGRAHKVIMYRPLLDSLQEMLMPGGKQARPP
ncbi:hypothetical protein HaLaN_30753 [Haematococcus lacustris]|uniref:Uncharacterized protein n=1 Tax=Haematococcus lacustris TaxID=44745 RepID=A0A699ZME2_HAELA|nr:hypothetical protein HaLaN_21517 [Haematococcus lacustris]GFH31669.1 hypothetical protein HaLaN_30753 [Haematococcus lacustris]